MTNIPSKARTTRRPDCVTERCCSNTVLTVSGCFKQNTAAGKMAKVLEVEATGQPGQSAGRLPPGSCSMLRQSL